MSVFHRIDDSPAYPDGARWFERALLLPHRPGVVRVRALEQAVRPATRSDAFDQVPAVPDVPVRFDDLGLINTYSTVRREDLEVAGA